MNNLQFKLTPDVLEYGSDCERAAFGLVEINYAGRPLLSGFRDDYEAGNYTRGPYVSGYHLAEWLAWNWWRLRWEPPPQCIVPPLEWRMAHEMGACGHGYVWPNVTISSDGFRCTLESVPSNDPSMIPISYIGAVDGMPAVVMAADFEQAVDEFILLVLSCLAVAGIRDSNLHRIWDDLKDERNDPALTRFRRFEALLGFDPNEIDEALLECWLTNSSVLGAAALDELAVGAGDRIMSARQIDETSRSAAAFYCDADEGLRWSRSPVDGWGQLPADRVGADIARAAREQAGLADAPLDNRTLADLAGVSDAVFCFGS